MMRIQIKMHPLSYFRLLCKVKKKPIVFPNAVCYYATTVELDFLTNDFFDKYKAKQKNNTIVDIFNLSVRCYNDHGSNSKDVTQMTEEELQTLILDLLAKNKDSRIEQLLTNCRNSRKFIGDLNLKKLFRHYSSAGKPEMILIVQNYCLKVDPNLYRRTGKFLHFMAKAQCIKGNSNKGLSILKECYSKNQGLRSFYRIIFRELIQDAVINKSEASLVVFKRYVMDFSHEFNEHYPLVCFWHLCWSSSWFSDQVLSEELLECSETLRDIVRDKATAFSMTVLRDDFNEDAVTRLLQALLKYQMMADYVKVLQVLFNFKIRKRDIRGCREIIRNCEILGVTLPSDQQGRYIKMLIHGKNQEQVEKPAPKTSKGFKLKF